MSVNLNPDLIDGTIAFHGHWCPGLALGIRASEWALREIGRADDEEIVAVVETDMCGVDAIQFLTCCTFGKGNLIYKDYGKNAFTFYRRRDGKSARLVARPEAFGDAGKTLGRLHRKMQSEGLTDDEEALWNGIRVAISERIMESAWEDLFEIKQPNEPTPQKARILSSLVCERCGEPVMETRTRRFGEQCLCIPCFDQLERRY